MQWRRFTADAFLVHAIAVITTPSTIALDAARYGVPTALATYGIAAQNYAPLPRLEQAGDWLAFVDQMRRGLYERKKLDSFFADATVPGDAVARIVTVIKMAGARRSHAEVAVRAAGSRDPAWPHPSVQAEHRHAVTIPCLFPDRGLH